MLVSVVKQRQEENMPVCVRSRIKGECGFELMLVERGNGKWEL